MNIYHYIITVTSDFDDDPQRFEGITVATSISGAFNNIIEDYGEHNINSIDLLDELILSENDNTCFEIDELDDLFELARG